MGSCDTDTTSTSSDTEEATSTGLTITDVEDIKEKVVEYYENAIEAVTNAVEDLRAINVSLSSVAEAALTGASDEAVTSLGSLGVSVEFD